MNNERLKHNDTDELGVFFSDITGLPVTHAKLFPEVLPFEVPSRFSINSRFEIPFYSSYTLGNSDDQYLITIGVTFTNQWTPGEWLPNTNWRVEYNGEPICKEHDSVLASVSLKQHELTDTSKISKLLSRETRHMVGGPKIEVPFMDYEIHTLHSLDKEASYLKNIYLVLMTHMKERSLPMPPILSKRPDIRTAMFSGDIKTIDSILHSISVFDASNYDTRCQNHLRLESEEIRRHALWERDRRNSSIPLSETYPHLEVSTIKEGKSTFQPYNLLVVENDLHSYGNFTDAVINSLEKDGRYKNSKIIKEYNLHMCILLCESGRIDMVLFDWTNPSFEEALMIQRESNPFFDLSYGSTQAVLNFDENGDLSYGLPDGRVLDNQDLKQDAENHDIRSAWMREIEVACRKAGVIIPPHYNVRYRSEKKDLAKIISQKLGNPIS